MKCTRRRRPDSANNETGPATLVTGPARVFYTHFDDMWFFYGPAAVASALLMPMVILDIVRVSNRFVGPLVRLRRSLRELARGEKVEPIRFREGDFWQEIAEEFNAVAARFERVSSGNPPTAATSETDPEEADRDHEPVLAASE